MSDGLRRVRFGSGIHRDDVSRRAFLAAAAAAGLSAPAWSQSRRRPRPVERVNIAVIGAGGQGAANMSKLIGENIVALADVDMARVDRSLRDRDGKLMPEREPLKAAYEKAAQYTDFRRMFDARKDIEAVLIATPDHHHALAARMAMERGLHVFVQKPLTWSVRESRMLEAMARGNPKLTTQMGNQGHSSDDGRRVVDLVRGGAIGKVSEVQVWTNRPVWPQGVARPMPQLKPQSLDWDLWLGPADVAWGYHPDYAHFNWRGWTPFGTGALGDMGAHLLDFPVWALETGLPTRIETRHTLWGGDTNPWDAKRPDELTSFPLASVTHYEFANAKAGPVRVVWCDGGLMPPTPAGFPSGLAMNPGGGVLFIGDKGMLLHETYGDKPVLIGDEALARGAAIAPALPRIEGGRGGHEMNWIRAIRGQEKISSPIEVAAPLNETMVLGIVAMLSGEPLQYDGATGRFPNSPAAEVHLGRVYRKGWEVAGV
jgi:predicted dehydrogenase